MDRMSGLRTFLRDIDDDELVVKILESYLCTWEHVLGLHEENTNAVIEEIQFVIQDLAERKKRLRDVEFEVNKRSDFFSSHE